MGDNADTDRAVVELARRAEQRQTAERDSRRPRRKRACLAGPERDNAIEDAVVSSSGGSSEAYCSLVYFRLRLPFLLIFWTLLLPTGPPERFAAEVSCTERERRHTGSIVPINCVISNRCLAFLRLNSEISFSLSLSRGNTLLSSGLVSSRLILKLLLIVLFLFFLAGLLIIELFFLPLSPSFLQTSHSLDLHTRTSTMNFKTVLAALSIAATANGALFPSSSLLYKPSYASTATVASASVSQPSAPVKTAGLNQTVYEENKLYTPKVVIVNMFSLEEEPFHLSYEFVHHITLPGLSPIYSEIHCDANYELCQLTVGEGEINAASSLTAFALSPLFDLSSTFFLIAGIAGISPLQGTIGDVTFARFAVQILEYEVDARDLPSNWTTGYFALGSEEPGQYPENIYGTEVFELNANLRDRALSLAQGAFLFNGSATNEEFRSTYNYSPANKPPKAIACDTLTGDTYWFGELLDQTFANYTSLITNGTGTYCTTQQEDNASLEALIRAAMYGLVDFSRIVVMRTASDFTYSNDYAGNKTVEFFDDVYQGGITASVVNLVYASKPFISDILDNFELYDSGIYGPDNYIGDFFNSLGDDLSFRTWGTPEWGTA